MFYLTQQLADRSLREGCLDRPLLGISGIPTNCYTLVIGTDMGP
jgi:hypothetical protein